MADLMKGADFQPPQSLLHDVAEGGGGTVRRHGRNAVLALFILFILIGLFGVYDMGGTKEAKAGPVSITVDYPSTTRAGQDIRLITHLSSESALPDTVYLEIDQDYLRLFEDLLFIPEAESQTGLEDGRIRLEYQVPTGSTNLMITIEGRAADQWTPQRSGTLQITIPGEGSVEIPVRTWRFP